MGGTDYSNVMWFRFAQGLPTAIVALIPLSLIKDMSGFRYVSFASIIALFYTGIVLLIELKPYADHYSHDPFVTIDAANFNIYLFKGACMTFFAYTCQVQLLPIYSELINPNEKRIKKVISRSIAVDLLFYLTIGCAGYFSTFSATKDIVLLRDPLEGTTRDYAILIAVLSIIVVLFVAVPVNYNPFRTQIFYVVFKKEDFTFKE